MTYQLFLFFLTQFGVNPQPATTAAAPQVQLMPSQDISAIADVIGAAESDDVGGYNAANAGRAMDLGRDGLINVAGRPCTEVTIGEIKAWQRRGLLFAVGRYQMIPSTLKAAQHWAGLSDDTVFSPNTQDRLLKALLKHKRPNVWLHLQGKATRAAALTALAKEWAGIPTPTGRSYYSGYNGNHTNVTVAQAYEALAQSKL